MLIYNSKLIREKIHFIFIILRVILKKQTHNGTKCRSTGCNITLYFFPQNISNNNLGSKAASLLGDLISSNKKILTLEAAGNVKRSNMTDVIQNVIKYY